MTTAHRNLKFIWSILISLVLAGFLILSQITFMPQLGKWLSTLATSTLSKTWWLGITSSYGLHILADAAILWALAGLMNRTLHVSDAGRFWLLAFWTGWGLAFGLLLIGYPFYSQNVFNATFLLSRNAFPFITGLFLMILAQPYVRKFAGDRRLSLAVWLLLTINLIFPSDILKTNAGVSVSSALIFGCLALILVARPTWLTQRFWLTIPIGFLSTIFMGWYQVSRQADLTAASRFVIPMSPLTLIPALLIVQWLRQRTAPSATGKQQWWLTASYLTILTSGLLATGPAYSNFWVKTASLFQKHLSFLGPLWVFASAFVLTGLATLLTLVIYGLVPRMRIWTRLGKFWSLDLADALAVLINDWRHVLTRIWSEYWRPAVAFITFYLIQCLSSLLMNQSWHMTELMTHAKDNIISSTVIHGSAKMLCGALIMLAFYWVILALFNRYWLALISVAVFFLGFGVASRLKILSRSEPVVPADLSELTNVKSLLRMVSTWIIIAVVIVVILAIIGVVWLERHAQNAHQTWPTRLAKLVLSLWFIFGLGALNHSGQIQNRVLNALNVWTSSNLDELLFAQENGPIMSFVSMMDVNIMDKPAGYSESAIKTIIKRYKKQAKQINQTRTTDAKDLTIMFNLSESFSNPTAIKGVKLNANPIPYIDKLKTETTSGRMLAASFGGGTANMEYMSLTGMSMGLFASAGVVPNNMVVPNQKTSPNIGNLFTYDAAIHPYTGGYYNRVQVYRKYDFNKFAYLGSPYKIIDQHKIGTSIYNSDTTAYANGYKQITSRKGGQFINLITIQNHMPYTQDWYPDHDYKVSGNGFTNQQKAEIERYTQGIHYTDAAVKAFITKLDKLNKPVIMVFYGDHLPGTYTLPDRVDKYATDYFIYANKYARDHGAKTKLANKGYVSTNDFIALALEQANAKVDGYSALLTEVADKLPAIWQSKSVPQGASGTEQLFVDDQGKPLSESSLTKKQKQIVADYRMIQYDITAGKSYATKLGFTTTVTKSK